MSGFGAKRKPRKIQVDEDEDDGNSGSIKPSTPQNSSTGSKFTRKPLKKSTLRQSITFDDIQAENSGGDEAQSTDHTPVTTGDLNTLGVTATSRLDAGHIGSIGKKKKKAASSRLSFGPGEIISGDDAEALEENGLFTPKKSGVGRRVIEQDSLRKSLPTFQLPIREDDEQRPSYSKEYLNELKSSTPTTPKNLEPSTEILDDDEGLDESELEGAMIVDTEAPEAAPTIPTEAEIREKKERRARLAHEKDFISLNDDDDDRGQQVSLLPRKKKESRLVREDEDLGEGFDEFVEDGRISLGKKAEREAKKRHRAEMASMIHEAEGSSSDDTDDSEAERRTAYEAAQTRAGMDGLSRPDPQAPTSQVPPKITPLPNLAECLERLQATLSGMEQELAKRNKRLDDLQLEKKEILAREEEVQRLLKEAGERYAAMRADTGLPAVDTANLVQDQNGFTPLVMNRGLESFGNTPVGRPEVEDTG